MEILVQQNNKESLNPVNFHNLYLSIHDKYESGILEVNDNSYIQGEIDVQYAYRYAIEFLENLFLDPNLEEPFNKRLIINMPDSNEYFEFQDLNTQYGVAMTWGGSQPGMTERQIKNVTLWPNGNTLKGLKYWKDAEYFNEFPAFVKLTTPNRSAVFKQMPKLIEIDCTNLTKMTEEFFGSSLCLKKVGADYNNELPNLHYMERYVFNHTALEKINIPNLYDQYIQCCFYDCQELKEAHIDGNYLTRIGSETFRECRKLERVTGLTNVTTIDSYAFDYCQKLTHVDNLANVTSFGERAFNQCTLLEDIDLRNATYIGASAFNYTAIREAQLDSIRECRSAFYQCPNLERVHYGDEYTDFTITSGSFYGSTSLREINLDNCKIIESEAFRGCTVLSDIGNTTHLIRFDGSNNFLNTYALQSIDLSNLKNIPNGCFYYSGVKTIGDTSLIEKIGSEAFEGSGLTGAFSFPALQILCSQAFRACKNITSLDLGPISYIETSDQRENWRDCTSLQTFTALSLLKLGNSEFLNDAQLTTLNLPEVTSCGNYTFENCTALTDLSLPKLTSCGYQSFYNSGIKHCSFPLLETAGEECFRNSEKLLSINLPSLKTIKVRAFYNCKNLEEVNDMLMLETIENSAFDLDKNIIGTINIPNVTSIGTWAFSQCENVEHIILGNGITTIEKGTFWHCYNLRELNTTNWESIDAQALSNCQRITQLDLSNVKYLTGTDGQHFVGMNQLTTITSLENLESMGGNSIFADCINLVTCPLSNKIKTINQATFCRCNKLENIGDLSGVTTILWQAFDNTPNLNYSGNLNNVKYINNYAFRSSGIGPNLNAPLWDTINESNDEGACFAGCKKMITANIPSLNVIPKSCFSECQNLESITFSQNLNEIKQNAFRSCYKLNNLDLPGTIKTLGSECFSWCSGLTTLTCRATTPPTTASNIFNGTNNLQHIYVPAGSVDTYKTATGWSGKASIIQAIPS